MPAKDGTFNKVTAVEGEFSGGVIASGFTNRLDATSGISWLAGEVDPTGQFQAQPGSLYSRRNGSMGELWVQTGPTANDWTRVA